MCYEQLAFVIQGGRYHRLLTHVCWTACKSRIGKTEDEEVLIDEIRENIFIRPNG
jgi:hypothetical protein